MRFNLFLYKNLLALPLPCTLLIPTFAGHKSSSYSSYEDDIDTNRILIQKSTILKRQTIKISCLRQLYKQNTYSKKKDTKKYIFRFFFLKSILLINLSQTAYFDGLTLQDCRFMYKDSIGINIIFIRAIGARFMPREGRYKV